MLNIIDEVMGSGKTTAAIHLINLLLFKNVIFVTPYLTEVDRIMQQTGLETQTSEPKILQFRKQIMAGKSVVITHALFDMITTEDAKIIKQRGYTLIMDEVPGVISSLDISPYDADILWNNFISADERGRVSWNCPDYYGAFFNIKELANSGSLYTFANNVIFSMTSPDIYLAFKDVYILTYMFDSQILHYYFEYHGIETARYRIDSIHKSHNFAELIHIVDDLGNYPDKFALSKSWYMKASESDLTALKNHTYNFFVNKPTVWDPVKGIYARAKSKEALWTTFLDYRSSIAGKGYSKGFVPCNMRASNAYGDRHAVAYLINRFMNPNIKNFFLSNNVQVDEDGFALSEMLQIIWRSAIRNGERISVYIPSARMRSLMVGWIGNFT